MGKLEGKAAVITGGSCPVTPQRPNWNLQPARVLAILELGVRSRTQLLHNCFRAMGYEVRFLPRCHSDGAAEPCGLSMALCRGLG
jgi:hypothetical protein